MEEVVKLGLYYAATSPEFGVARKLCEFAIRCAERVPGSDARLKYDSMFEAGVLANKEFWVKQSPRVPGFVNSFVRLRS